ncbi:hypothetical protein L3X38_041891 [Prunus dulcis]|uniref:Ubiquitin-like protease family profile domain-containing protein n=1 Tax=Prunus dulcis TaxID=3755 RepID=A0AAD4UVI4_PRUDU|nr:hypothetical protein L3X38_041891 [Prunus dulcis]
MEKHTKFEENGGRRCQNELHEIPSKTVQNPCVVAVSGDHHRGSRLRWAGTGIGKCGGSNGTGLPSIGGRSREISRLEVSWSSCQTAENLDETDLSKLDILAPLLALCQYVETKLKTANETIRIHLPEEVFGTEHDTWILGENILQFASMVEIGSTVIALYMRYLFAYLKMENMVNLVGLVDPGQVSSQSGTLSHRSKHLSECLKNADGDQFYLVPYNPGGHWVLIIVKPAKDTIYYMDSLPNCSVDEDMRNIVNT